VLLTALLAGLLPVGVAGEVYVPEPGSKEAKEKSQGEQAYDASLPNVLIIGDSISIGYTPYVKKLLAGKANVFHNPGNSEGTTHGVKNIKAWVAPQYEKPWAVIHVNFGLHDIKHVDPATKNNSNNASDPPQADVAKYTTQLTTIMETLVATKATIIFATTTPYPAGVKPYREPADAARYNAAALSVVGKHEVIINDLYAFIEPHLEKVQQPVNVHFKPEGSQALGEEVVKKILAVLAGVK
jgi:acyl-CoA thioesterase-1